MGLTFVAVLEAGNFPGYIFAATRRRNLFYNRGSILSDHHGKML
jgi:glucuronate isomerase